MRLKNKIFKAKTLILFISSYLLIIIISDLVFALFITGNFLNLFEVLKSLPASFSPASLPCLIFPPNFFNQKENLTCPVDYSIIVANVYFAALSSYLFFTKKLKFPNWVVAFISLNLFVLSFMALKYYLDLNM